MIHTYKRKGNLLNTCSFYERLCGNSLAECSARATTIEDSFSNGCCSLRENENVCQEWFENKLSNNSKFYQPQPSEVFDAPPIKFKYARRRKELHKSGGSPQHVAVLPLAQEESQSISKIDTAQPELDRLCCDPCSLNHCGNDDMLPCGILPGQTFSQAENKLGRVLSNMSDNESSYSYAFALHKTDSQGRDREDVSSFQNCVELEGMKCAAPLQTYSRRSRDNKDSHRMYAGLMAERSTCLACDQSFSKNAENPVGQGVVKTMELSELKLVDEYSRSYSQSFGKLTDGVSSVGNIMYSQENQKVRNGRPLFDDSDVSTIPSFNDETVTCQPDDTIKAQHNICDLSLYTASKESSTDTVMAGAYESIILNSQNYSDGPDKAKSASKDFSGCAVSLDCSVLELSYSDKRSEVDVNLASSTQCQEVVPLQSDPHQHSADKSQAASVHADDPKANFKERFGTMSDGMKDSNGLFDINVKLSENQLADPVASSTDSARIKVLRLFPEDATDNALRHNTSKSGLVPVISSNSCSVAISLPDQGVRQDIIQDKLVETSNQAKLLHYGIRSFCRPQMEGNEGFRQEFQPFSSVWCEEELDNLWIGVRRHGKDNWYAMLRDPRLRFAPWRTAMDLAEKWRMEQTKLLESTSGTEDQPSNTVGVSLDSYRSSVPPLIPPGPGFMTRFLTDPMQLSLSNAHFNKQGNGMFPRPPRPHLTHNSTNAPGGNETRVFNRRARAHRKSPRPESKWGRFKVANQVMPPPQLPNYVARKSRINMLPSYIGDAFHYPHHLPPLPVPPLSAQHSKDQSPYDILNNSATGSSTQKGFHLSNTITECPTLAAFLDTAK